MKAYINGQYVEVADRVPTPEEIREQKLAEIEEIKKELAKYDYIGIKIATGCASMEQYAPEITHCQELRKRINELEKEVGDEG